MATIMEGALWTLTEAAAERMVENGLIVQCDEEDHPHTLDVDKPIYHIAEDAPGWFGMGTLNQAIISAEAHVTPEEADAPES